MSTGILNTRPLNLKAQRWRLKLSAEISPEAAPVTAEQVRSLAELINRVPGLSEVSVRPGCGGAFVRAELTVDASNLADAIDRAAAYLRSYALAARLGRVVLVAAGAVSGSPDRRG